MSQLLMIAHETRELVELASALARDSFTCKVIPHSNGFAREITTCRPDLVLVELDGYAANASIKELLQWFNQEGLGARLRMPLIPSSRRCVTLATGSRRSVADPLQ